MLENYLQELGLSQKEVDIYINLLSLAQATANEIAQKTTVKRTTVYPVLESLQKKGLVSETTRDDKVVYQAEPPERLETLLLQQKAEIEEKTKRLPEILAQLKSREYISGEKPIVKYFEGREGIMSSMDDFWGKDKDGGTAYFLYPRDKVREIFDQEYLNKLQKSRANKDIESIALYTEKNSAPIFNLPGNRKKINSNKYPITSDIAIYKDQVKINILGSRLGGISIKSKEIAETLRSLFLLAFNNIDNNKDPEA